MRRTVTILGLAAAVLAPVGAARAEMGDPTQAVVREHLCADDGAFHTGAVGINCDDLDAHVAGVTGLAGAVVDEMVCGEAGVGGTGVVGANCDELQAHVDGTTGLAGAVVHELVCTDAGASLDCTAVESGARRRERAAAARVDRMLDGERDKPKKPKKPKKDRD